MVYELLYGIQYALRVTRVTLVLGFTGHPLSEGLSTTGSSLRLLRDGPTEEVGERQNGGHRLVPACI